MDVRLLSLIIGYGFGCLQFAYFFGKLKGIDIREHGSGNAGMTNITRTMGFKFGGVVFLLDVLKAMAAFLVATAIFGDAHGMFSGISLPGLYAGFGAILGHNFPFFMKFRGGKGVSCTAGVIIAFDWRIALALFLISLTALIIWRFISLCSLIIALMFPISMVVFRAAFEFGAVYATEMIALAFVIGALCWFQHRGNIVRLLSGTERKFGEKR